MNSPSRRSSGCSNRTVASTAPTRCGVSSTPNGWGWRAAPRSGYCCVQKTLGTANWDYPTPAPKFAVRTQIQPGPVGYGDLRAGQRKPNNPSSIKGALEWTRTTAHGFRNHCSDLGYQDPVCVGGGGGENRLSIDSTQPSRTRAVQSPPFQFQFRRAPKVTPVFASPVPSFEIGTHH